MDKNVVAVILAAGSSSRLGQSKQLLKHKNKTLLRRTVEQALASKATEVLVILGSKNKEHKSEIKDLPVHIEVNHHWEKGMGNSLKYGVKAVKESFSESNAIMVMVCDQAYISSDQLDLVLDAFFQGKGDVIASSYSDTIGVPVLFDQKYYRLLLNIKDNAGAKHIIKNMETYAIPFPNGEIDIDTKNDLEHLK